MSSQQINRRLGCGLLIGVYSGVYAVGHMPTGRHDQAAGALLACGPGAALSHGSAAALWGISKEWRLPIEVTAPCDRRPKGLCVHVSTRLTRADIRVHWGLRVTSPARTLLDNAPRLPGRRLTRVANDLRLAGRLQQEELADVVGRFPRHPGARRLRPLVARRLGPTRSELEDAFQRFIAEHGLPQPLVNTRVAGHEVDAYFAAERLIVELDGFDVHRTRAAFEADRRKDSAILAAAGIPTVRITYEGLTRRGGTEAANLHASLAARRKP